LFLRRIKEEIKEPELRSTLDCVTLLGENQAFKLADQIELVDPIDYAVDLAA